MLIPHRLIRWATVAIPLLCLQAGAQAKTTTPASGSFLTGGIGTFDIVGSADDNDVYVNYEGDFRYVIYDRAGIVGGTQIDPQTTSGFEHDPSPTFSFLGNGGDDSIVFSATLPAQASVTAFGDPGADTVAFEPATGARGRLYGGVGPDRVLGGDGQDALQANGGADRVNGRGGDDHVTAGPGPDKIRGGPGDDKLSASALGKDRDRLIDCGPGEDVAIIDRGTDPQPRHCERIRYRRGNRG